MKVLCLHGSRQDAVIFKSRIKALSKKLSPAGLVSGFSCTFTSVYDQIGHIKAQEDLTDQTQGTLGALTSHSQACPYTSVWITVSVYTT